MLLLRSRVAAVEDDLRHLSGQGQHFEEAHRRDRGTAGVAAGHRARFDEPDVGDDASRVVVELLRAGCPLRRHSERADGVLHHNRTSARGRSHNAAHRYFVQVFHRARPGAHPQRLLERKRSEPRAPSRDDLVVRATRDRERVDRAQVRPQPPAGLDRPVLGIRQARRRDEGAVVSDLRRSQGRLDPAVPGAEVAGAGGPEQRVESVCRAPAGRERAFEGRALASEGAGAIHRDCHLCLPCSSRRRGAPTAPRAAHC